MLGDGLELLVDGQRHPARAALARQPRVLGPQPALTWKKTQRQKKIEGTKTKQKEKGRKEVRNGKKRITVPRNETERN